MAVRDAEIRSDGSDASGAPETTGDDADDHLADLPDGCGCAEVWKHLSERRE